MSRLDGSILEKDFPDYQGQIEHIVTTEEKDAETVPPSDVLPERIAEKLDFNLYTHQAEALNELKYGENVCVSTSTSSGKTMVYALHIARETLSNPHSTALIVYPTKALSRDQQEALTELYDELDLDIAVRVYDGDTPREERPDVRENADVIITNFAGINHYIPHHEKWSGFFSNLSLFAIDESHSYTGVLGMHVAWIIRRLKRIVEYYNAEPQYVMTSATIGNPKEHSESLVGEKVFVIDNDGSPNGKRTLVFWNPPPWDNDADDDKGTVNRKPASVESSRVLAHLTAKQVQTLQFASSRKLTELTAHRAEEYMEEDRTPYNPASVEIESYHAGHGKETRRETEERLKNGEIEGLVSTEALELGIDIGGVDGTIISGYPGTRQSFWQQIGRSGRGKSEALSVYIADYDSIDQYLISNPEYLKDDYVEDAVVDLANNEVYSQHILCAAREIALTHDDKDYFGDERLERVVRMWKKAGRLAGGLESGVQYTGTSRPEAEISLYASSDESFEVRLHPEADGELDLEPVDKDRAYRDFYEGAIYMHKSERYQVVKFVDQGPQQYIVLRPAHDIQYYTRSKSETRITNVTPEKQRDIGDFTLYWGTGTVTAHYQFYDKIDINTNRPIDKNIPTGLQPLEMKTQLMWLEVPDYLESALVNKYSDYEAAEASESPYNGYMGGLHAAEHAMINVAPLELMMDKQDLGGLSTFSHPAYDTSGFFIYDGISGGLGFSRTLYEKFEEISIRTRELIASCECTRERGCPACVMDDNCGDQNSPLHTSAAIEIFDFLLGESTKDDIEPYLDNNSTGVVTKGEVSYSNTCGALHHSQKDYCNH